MVVVEQVLPAILGQVESLEPFERLLVVRVVLDEGLRDRQRGLRRIHRIVQVLAGEKGSAEADVSNGEQAAHVVPRVAEIIGHQRLENLAAG